MAKVVIITYSNGRVRHIPDLPKVTADQIVRHIKIGRYFGMDNIIYPTRWMVGVKAA